MSRPKLDLGPYHKTTRIFVEEFELGILFTEQWEAFDERWTDNESVALTKEQVEKFLVWWSTP